MLRNINATGKKVCDEESAPVDGDFSARARRWFLRVTTEITSGKKKRRLNEDEQKEAGKKKRKKEGKRKSSLIDVTV